MIRHKMSVNELTRFLQRIKPEGACLIWTGAKTYNGYGVKVVAGKQTGAHRAAYQHYIGLIPKGLEIHHTCRRRDCVNHKHMILVTHKAHMGTIDYSKIIRTPQKKRTHCKYGHELKPENVWTLKRKIGEVRICRQCHVKTGRRRGFCLKGHPTISGRCPICTRETVKKWRKNNLEKIRIYKQEWKLRHNIH